MRILFISAFPPCQKTAGQDYTRRLIIDLLEKGHEGSLIYADYPEHKIDLPKAVQVIGIIIPSLKNCFSKISFHPFFTKRFEQKTLQLLISVSKNYDMLYFDFSQVHLYSLFVEHPNIVLMCHDVIAQKFSRKGLLQLPWIKFSEGKLLCNAKQIVTFSQKDSAFIKNIYGLESVYVNFYLKHGYYDYSKSFVYEKKFCFYGAWNRKENIESLEWFLKKVYPKLNDEFEFVIIGGGMSDYLKNKICLYKNFLYLGFVDNPIKEISHCQALIAPLHKGAGVKVKVIDALTSGTCVVGTNVAFEGIKDNNIHKLFLKAETSEEFYSILKNWKQNTVESKQGAADEFYERYNKNHFTDLL